MLFWPEAFEPLTDTPWNEGRVLDRIGEVVADVDAAFDGEDLWPAHEWDGWRAPLPLRSLYVGAAGVVHAVDVLRRRGLAEPRTDLRAAALRALELYRREPDFVDGYAPPEPTGTGLFVGETGILVVAWRLTGDDVLADELHARVLENRDGEGEDVMYGAPGSLLAARALHEWMGDQRWLAAWREVAGALLARRDEDGLWTQRRFGQASRALGAPHGVTGNVAALLAGGLLEPDEAERLRGETAAMLARTAFLEHGLVNWPLSAGGPLEEDGEVRLQWCSGTPGVLVAAGACLDEELLLAGAETVWRAGPHGDEKGAGICHGTAGNGYALLAAFARTGDERWLERARRFAVHALEQAAGLRAERGHGRYSLFTGDVGTALLAADCLAARADYPVLGTWE